jgi:hypothetical protein
MDPDAREPAENRKSPGEKGNGEAAEPPLVTLARFSGHGLTLAVSTGLFLLAGWWADGKLGTTPLLTIVGAMVGAAAGFYSMLQHLVLGPAKGEADGNDSGRGSVGPPGRGPSDDETGEGSR